MTLAGKEPLKKVGKVYFQFTIVKRKISLLFGIINEDGLSKQKDINDNAISYNAYTGYIWENNCDRSSGSSLNAGDSIQVVLDWDNKRMQWWKNREQLLGETQLTEKFINKKVYMAITTYPNNTVEM